MTRRVDLPDGGVLHIRDERVGRDSLIRAAVRAKIEGQLPQYDMIGGWDFTQDFADLMAQVESVEGLEGFEFPKWPASDEELAAAFELWLGLPEAMVKATRRALTPPERTEPNAKDLLPSHKRSEADKADPLPASGEQLSSPG